MKNFSPNWGGLTRYRAGPGKTKSSAAFPERRGLSTTKEKGVFTILRPNFEQARTPNSLAWAQAQTKDESGTKARKQRTLKVRPLSPIAAERRDSSNAFADSLKTWHQIELPVVSDRVGENSGRENC
jgi:hypothetical protein